MEVREFESSRQNGFLGVVTKNPNRILITYGYQGRLPISAKITSAGAAVSSPDTLWFA
jgi:hypothetical protein